MKILVIDDDYNDTILIRRELDRTGHPVTDTVTTVVDEQGLRLALKERQDVMVCDYILPSMPWPIAMRIARELQPDIAVVALSGVMDDDRGRAAIADGADEYLAKNNLKLLYERLELAILTRQALYANRTARHDLEKKIGTGPLDGGANPEENKA